MVQSMNTGSEVDKYVVNVRTYSTCVLHQARVYWSLTKSLQTGLLLMTGLAGYMSCSCPVLNWKSMLALTGSLYLAISGSTIINMWYDRDIDLLMPRTCNRPLPIGAIRPAEALRLGGLLTAIGIGWSLWLSPLFGAIVFAGMFLDVCVYTLWLKRRSPWSVLWGGISGGMPILAGRALALGYIDWIGICLSAAVLFWIPTHIVTFSIRYHEDYQKAGVPTLAFRYGMGISRRMVAASSFMATLAILLAAAGVGMTGGYLHLLGLFSAGLIVLSMYGLLRPSDRINFRLFKYASLYMFGAMLLIILI